MNEHKHIVSGYLSRYMYDLTKYALSILAHAMLCQYTTINKATNATEGYHQGAKRNHTPAIKHLPPH
jgi:hypothetical protein